MMVATTTSLELFEHYNYTVWPIQKLLSIKFHEQEEGDRVQQNTYLELHCMGWGAYVT